MHGIQNDFIVSQENLSRRSSTSMNKPTLTALKLLRTQILKYCYDNCDCGAAKWNCPAACVNLINTFLWFIYFMFTFTAEMPCEREKPIDLAAMVNHKGCGN